MRGRELKLLAPACVLWGLGSPLMRGRELKLEMGLADRMADAVAPYAGA